MKQLSQHQAGEGDEVQPGQHDRQAFVVTGQTAEAGRPGESTLHDHHPAPRQQDEAAFGPLALGQFDVVAGHRLHLGGERRDLRPVLFVGRGDGGVKRPQVAERIYRRVDFRSLPRLPLVPVEAGPLRRAAVGRALQRAAVQDHRRRLYAAAGRQAQQRTHVGDQRLEAAWNPRCQAAPNSGRRRPIPRHSLPKGRKSVGRVCLT